MDNMVYLDWLWRIIIIVICNIHENKENKIEKPVGPEVGLFVISSPSSGDCSQPNQPI